MPNVMPTARRNDLLRLLVEGNGVRAAARLMRTNIPTVLRQLVWAGDHCRRVLDERLTGLHLGHVECDEMWTFCGKKQARLTVEQKALAHDIGDIYFWYGIDGETKLIPAFLLGKRTADNARRFMLDLASRLVFPATGHGSDAHAFGLGGYLPVVQISTDGLAAYPEAVDLAFGAYVKYGTIVKEYRNAHIVYEPSEIVGTKRRAVFGMDESEVRSICTSHVERSNLTVRTFMRRFTRLALGFSKKLANLEAACALHVAYYNFCWRPREPGKRGRLRPTPAVAAGLTNHQWSFHELMAA